MAALLDSTDVVAIIVAVIGGALIWSVVPVLLRGGRPPPPPSVRLLTTITLQYATGQVHVGDELRAFVDGNLRRVRVIAVRDLAPGTEEAVLEVIE